MYLCDLCTGYSAAIYAPKPNDYTVQIFARKEENIAVDFVGNILRRSVDERHGIKEKLIAQHLPDWLAVVAVLHNFKDICSQEKPK